MLSLLLKPWVLIAVIGTIQTVYLFLAFRGLYKSHEKLEELLREKTPKPAGKEILCVRCKLKIDTQYPYCPWCGASQFGETIADCIRQLYRGFLDFKGGPK